MPEIPALWHKIAWWVWAGVGCVLEAVPLWEKDYQGTLTAQIRGIVKKRFLWWAGVGLSAWSFLHFFFNRE